MKHHFRFVAVVLLSSSTLFGQSGEVKPKKITEKPAPTDFFFSNKATKPNKLDREAPIVVTQFNVTIPQDQEIYARSGTSVKRDADEAQVLLRFHISNLDKVKFQKTTNELADYLKERLKAQGFKIADYSEFSSGKKYPDLDAKPAPKGEIPDLYGPAFTVPGEFKPAKKAVMYSAYEQPLYASQAMKVGYIAMEKKINLLTFGLVLNFMEYASVASEGNKANSVNISFSPQIYGDPWIVCSSHNMKGSIWIQPNSAERPKDATYGYTYGREFATNVNKETGDIEIDNDKFNAAYLELVKSYIDNMTALMAESSK